MIQKAYYGQARGEEVYLYTMDNGCGLSAEILSYGGIIKNLIYRGVDVSLGRDTMEQYLNNDGCMGVLVGRNSNRLEDASFCLNGKTYTLAKNNGRNNLHGGDKDSFMLRVWNCEMVDGEEPALVLTLHSPDGEEGFPGNADVKVTYTLTKDNQFKIDYIGVCDQDTLMNLTQHCYFNLNGHDSGATNGHTVQLDADFFTPNNDECMPTGEILSVAGTAFDLRTPKKMGEVYSSKEEQITMFDGFDHNFCLRGRGYRKVGTFTGDQTGIAMEIYTDLPGVQIYCGNCINTKDVYKGGASYVKHQGVCFETQAFPNAMSHSHFPSIVLKQGETYQTTTSYKFI
ncbi:MAG: galactose mutarotase [Clostridia bacterium]|nr:galactose mutarotase [Clostridia bacterium]